VLELLKTNLCTDFEVLHCLNQMCEIEPTLTEFYRMRHRLSEGGPPLSRDEARNLVARMKDFQKQQRYLSRRVKESGDAGSKGKVTKDRVPPALPLTSKGKASGAGDAKPLQKADSESTPSIQQDASNSVGELLSAVFARGETNLSTFQEIKDRLAQAGSDMTETEWVLWQSFLSMALPMLEGIGSERAVYFLKKLSRELSGKQSPIEYWERLHPLDGSDSRVPFIAKPKGWHV
jgi:ParB family chromosome partitioning protein